MSDANTRSKLKLAIANIDALPAMPVIAQKLLSLSMESDNGEAQLINIIEQDPQLTAKIVGLANSPLMGLSRTVSSVHEAALLLGMTRVKSVALGIAAMAGFSVSKNGKNFKPQDLWLHSMTIAIIMRSIAMEIPPSQRPAEDDIFLAGLLHDIGFMVLHHIDPNASNELHNQLRAQAKRPVIDLELEILGITHCYMGAQLARAWHLPSEIVAAISYHHPPYVEKIAEKHRLVRLLNIAEKLLPDFGIAEHSADVVSDEEWLELGIAPEKADDINLYVSEIAVQTAQISNLD